MRSRLRLFCHRRTAWPFLLIVLLTPIRPVSECRADAEWEASAYKGWTVADVKIRGLDGDVASKLGDGLALAYTHGFLGKNKATFYPKTLAEDIERCRLFLARRGYPYARVEPSFEAAPLRERVTVVLNIDPGPPVLVSGLRVDGLTSDVEATADELSMVNEGTVFTDRKLARAVNSVDSLLAERGYAHAEVNSRLVWQDSTRTTVVISTEPGPICYFRDVDIDGADTDVAPLGIKVADIKPGTRFSRHAIDDAQENLRSLSLFRQTQIQVEKSAAPESLDVRIRVGMREFRTFDVSGRYWSDDGLSGSLRWTHRNRFKRGRGATLVLFASGPEQVAKLSAWWPAIFWPRSRAIGSLGTTRESEEAYEVIDTGVTLSLLYEWSPGSKLWVATGFSNVVVTSRTTDYPDLGDKDEGLLTTLSLGGERNASNDPIFPTRGTVSTLAVEWAPPGSISDNHYIKGEGTGIVYMPLPLSTSLAARATVGLGKPTDTSSSILPNKRFYSGGSNSMRGFKRRKLGPLDSGGAPLGGEALLEMSLEWRFPLPWRFAGTLFVDSGQVWPTIDRIEHNNIEVAVGGGLWINTIIGPIRGDIARRVTYYETSQPRWVFHFAVGPAF